MHHRHAIFQRLFGAFIVDLFTLKQDTAGIFFINTKQAF